MASVWEEIANRKVWEEIWPRNRLDSRNFRILLCLNLLGQQVSWCKECVSCTVCKLHRPLIETPSRVAVEQNVYSKFFLSFPKREHTNKSNSQSNSFGFLAKAFHPLSMQNSHSGQSGSQAMVHLVSLLKSLQQKLLSRDSLVPRYDSVRFSWPTSPTLPQSRIN